MTSRVLFPGSLTVRGGAIMIRCERCGDSRTVQIGMHTFAEFWELMWSRGWRLRDDGSGSDAVVLCPRCATQNSSSAAGCRCG